MAFMSQQRKAELAPAIKAVMKKYKLKGSLSVHNHSTLVLTIKSGVVDFIKNYNDTVGDNRRGEFAKDYLTVNPYWYHDHFSGDALNAVKELVDSMMTGNHNRSDIQTDYFDVGWYIDINFGQWNKPYECTTA